MLGWAGLAWNPGWAMLGWIGLHWNGLPLLGWRLVARIGFDCIGQSWIGLNRMEQRWTGFSWLDDWILLAGSPKWAVLCWAVLGNDCNGQGGKGLTGLDKLLLDQSELYCASHQARLPSQRNFFWNFFKLDHTGCSVLLLHSG